MKQLLFVTTLLIINLTSFAFSQSKQTLLNELFSIGFFKTGNFTLKSGLTSDVYLDLRSIISYPEILKNLSFELSKLINDINCEVMCGVPYTALPIATALSLQINKPMILKRREAKNYGTKNLVEGVFQKNDRCLVIEDVVTTGSSVVETVKVLEDTGMIVNDIIVCVDREQGGVEYLRSLGYHVHVLFTLSEIKSQYGSLK